MSRKSRRQKTVAKRDKIGGTRISAEEIARFMVGLEGRKKSENQESFLYMLAAGAHACRLPS